MLQEQWDGKNLRGVSDGMTGGRRTHFYGPYARSSTDIEDPFRAMYGSKEQSSIVDQFDHMVLHVQSIQFLLVVRVNVC